MFSMITIVISPKEIVSLSPTILKKLMISNRLLIMCYLNELNSVWSTTNFKLKEYLNSKTFFYSGQKFMVVLALALPRNFLCISKL